MRPLVSVVMPVYNGARDVRRAISSVFDQTFRDFELIVVNDGSQDDTAAVLDSMGELSDSRLRVVHLTRNVGVAAALNHGIGLAQGDYIARHDHDDISRPTRLEQQVRFMQAHPECGLLGTRSEIWAADEPTDRGHFHPLENPVLQFALLFDNYFVHSSVLIPKRVLNTVGLYSTDPLRQPPEDYELWSRIARHYEVRNLPEQLLIYREMPKSLSSSGREGAFSYLDKVVMISAENLAWRLGVPSPSQDCRDAAALNHAVYANVSQNVDIEAVCALVQRAARKIEHANPGAKLSSQVTQAINGIRHQHSVWLQKNARTDVRTGRVLPRRSLLTRLSPAALAGKVKRFLG
jgi:hypothetical protein